MISLAFLAGEDFFPGSPLTDTQTAEAMGAKLTEVAEQLFRLGLISSQTPVEVLNDLSFSYQATANAEELTGEPLLTISLEHYRGKAFPVTFCGEEPKRERWCRFALSFDGCMGMMPDALERTVEVLRPILQFDRPRYFLTAL